MRLKHKKILSFLFSAIILSLIGIFLYKNQEGFQEIQKIQPLYLIPLALVIIFGFFLNGLFLKLLAEPFNINLKKHFLLSLVSAFFNLITPFRGGAGVRAIYMKKKYKLNYTYFISSLFGNYVVIFLTSSFLALIFLSIIYFQYQIFNIYFFLIFLGIFIGTLVLVKLNFQFKKDGFFFRHINQLLEGWSKIAKHRQLVTKLTLNTIVQLINNALKIQIVFWSFGMDINIFKTATLSLMTVLGAFINITPGSLGVTETLYAISSEILAIPATIGILVALIIRSTSAITLLILGPIANYLLYKDLKNLATPDALLPQPQLSDE